MRYSVRYDEYRKPENERVLVGKKGKNRIPRTSSMQVARRRPPPEESLERSFPPPEPHALMSSPSLSVSSPASHAVSPLSPTLHTPSSPSAIERGALLEGAVSSFTHRFSDLLRILETTSGEPDASSDADQPPDTIPSEPLPETQPGQPSPPAAAPRVSSDPVVRTLTTSVKPRLDETIHFCDEFDICTESLEEHIKARKDDFAVQKLVQFDGAGTGEDQLVFMERLRDIYLRKKEIGSSPGSVSSAVKSQILMKLIGPRQELDEIRLREVKLRYELRREKVRGENLEFCLNTVSSRWDRYEFQVAPAMRARIYQLERRMRSLRGKIEECGRERAELREVKAQWLPIHEKLLKQRDRVQDLLQTDPADRMRSIREAIRRAKAEKARLESVKQRRSYQIAALEEQIEDHEDTVSDIKLSQLEAVQTKIAYEKRDVANVEHSIFRLHEAILLQQQETEKIWAQKCAREEKYLSDVREYQRTLRDIQQTIHETLQAGVAANMERDRSHYELLVIRRQKRRDDGFLEENRIDVQSSHSLQMDRHFHLRQRLEAAKSKRRALTKRLCSRKELISGLQDDIATMERLGRGLFPIFEERKAAFLREIRKRSEFDASVEESTGWGDVLTELEEMSRILRKHYGAGVD